MANTGTTTASARARGLAWGVGKLAEVFGLLNKGSADSPATPPAGARSHGISTNALNVTRVGGVASLISGAGAAALAIFHVDKSRDHTAVVTAAYASAGVIVAAALIAVALIIVADVRGRATVAAAAPAVPPVSVKEVVGSETAGVALDTIYDYVLVDATHGSVDLRLPSAASCAWRHMTVKRTDNTAPHHVRILSAENFDETPVAHDTERQLYSNGRTWTLL